MDPIHFFTPEQEALIPEYQQKWEKIALSTQPIDRVRAVAAVRGAYAVMNEPEPEIIICGSPAAALEILRHYFAEITALNSHPNLNEDGEPEDLLTRLLCRPLWPAVIGKKQKFSGIKPLVNLKHKVSHELQQSIAQRIDFRQNEDVNLKAVVDSLMIRMQAATPLQIKQLVCAALSTQENAFLKENPAIVASEITALCSLLDFVSSELGSSLPALECAALQGLAKQCGWILGVDELCVVCDRPTKIRTQNNKLHGETEPALEYSDGVVIYASRGSLIPKD
ncbi:MAG: DUF6745 domain-containing protein [Cyanobacteria bacterium J06649_4]